MTTIVETDLAKEDVVPETMKHVRNVALKAIAPLEPGASMSRLEEHGLFLSSRTGAGNNLPPYYLVYLLLVDLLHFPNFGRWEKVAWIVPVRYRGKLYSIEHRKMGLAVCAPTLDASAKTNCAPSAEAESDAADIVILIRNSVTAAEPYFEWRAERAAAGIDLNVVNNSDWLFARYEFFRDRYRTLSAEAESRRSERIAVKNTREDGTAWTSVRFPAYALLKEAEWNAQAAVDAFFSWTEHAFIHLAILLGHLRTGEDVAKMAAADWKTKFKAVFDVAETKTKDHYDSLLTLRTQIRNFMAHGAFGKRGEAFSFHTGAGAVPVMLTGQRASQYSMTGEPGFDENNAIAEIENFIEYLWSGIREPAKLYVSSGLPSILTYATDGTYARATHCAEDMKGFVDYLTSRFDDAANMDW